MSGYVPTEGAVLSENNEVQEIFPVRMSTKGRTFGKDFTGAAPVEPSPKDSSAPASAIDSEQPQKQTEEQGLPGAESVTPQAPDDPKTEKKDETSTSAPSPTSPQPPQVPSVPAEKASKSKTSASS